MGVNKTKGLSQTKASSVQGEVDLPCPRSGYRFAVIFKANRQGKDGGTVFCIDFKIRFISANDHKPFVGQSPSHGQNL